MKLEVGAYIRTNKGYIGKVIDEHYEDGDMELGQDDYYYVETDNKQNDDSVCPDYEDIIKSSHNIIDLIEVGDYVNGYKVTKISGTRYDEKDLHCYCNESWNRDKMCLLMIPAKDIKSIVTHEQFDSVKYEVKGE